MLAYLLVNMEVLRMYLSDLFTFDIPEVSGCTYLEPGLPDIPVESAVIFLAC